MQLQLCISQLWSQRAIIKSVAMRMIARVACALLVMLEWQALVNSCPTSCKCIDTEVTCRIPWARNIPHLRFPRNTTVLDLSDNNILNIDSTSLQNLANLEELNLSGNKIYFIENDAFKGWPKLRKLSLEDNNVHFIENDAFSSLHQLEELYLYKNKISSFPNLSNNVKLTKLCISDNDLEELPNDALTANVKLSELTLKKNQLSKISRDAFPKNVSSYSKMNLVSNQLQFIPPVIQEMKNLESLNLCYNPIKDFDADDIQPLINLKELSLTGVGLSRFPSTSLPYLQKLYLGKNRITENSLASMVFPSLQVLVLSSNNFSTIPGAAFVSVPSVTELCLAGSGITGIAGVALGQLTKLQSLNLRDNKLFQVPQLSRNVDLKKLNLNSNNIGEIHKSDLSNLDSLQELHLSNNSMTMFEVSPFPSVTLLDLSDNSFVRLPDNIPKSVETLNISRNPLTDIRSEDFSEFSNLTTLNLRGNNFTTIPNDLYLNLSSLKNLHLCHNRLRQLSAEALHSLPNLEVLTADDNQIEEIDEDTFSGNLKLQHLSLNKNGITTISKKAFFNLTALEELWLLHNALSEAPMIKENRRLRVLGLCNNPIGNLPEKALAGPKDLEVVLLRAMGLTKFPASVFGNAASVRNIHLAGNNLTSVPSAIRQMPALRVLKLTSNPINTTCVKDYMGLDNLRDLRLNNMKLEKLRVEKLFPALPGLRTFYLAGNPWYCDCEMQWFALGIDGARAKINTEDRSEITCDQPHRLFGKRFDYLRLGDFMHCLPGEVQNIGSTSAEVALPSIRAYSRDYYDAFLKVSYVPVGGGTEKSVVAASFQRKMKLLGLSSNTEYIVCVSTMVISKSAKTKTRKHAEQQRESCSRIKTCEYARNFQKENPPSGTESSAMGARDLIIVYGILGGSLGFSLIVIMVVFAAWCRKSKALTNEQFSNLSGQETSWNRSNGELGKQSTPKKSKDKHLESSVVSSGFPTPPSGANGGALMMEKRLKSGHVNPACDEIETVAASPRTKL